MLVFVFVHFQLNAPNTYI